MRSIQAVFFSVVLVSLTHCGIKVAVESKKTGWTSEISADVISDCKSDISSQVSSVTKIEKICNCWLNSLSKKYTPSDLATATTQIVADADLLREACGKEEGEAVFIISAMREPQRESKTPLALRKSLENSRRKAKEAADAKFKAHGLPPATPPTVLPDSSRPGAPEVKFEGTFGDKFRADNKKFFRELHETGSLQIHDDFETSGDVARQELLCRASMLADGEAVKVQWSSPRQNPFASFDPKSRFPRDVTHYYLTISLVGKKKGKDDTAGSQIRDTYAQNVHEFWTKDRTRFCMDKKDKTGFGKNMAPKDRFNKIATLIADTAQFYVIEIDETETQICGTIVHTTKIVPSKAATDIEVFTKTLPLPLIER